MHAKALERCIILSTTVKIIKRKSQGNQESWESWELRWPKISHLSRCEQIFPQISYDTERRIARLIFLFSVVARDLPLRSPGSCKLTVISRLKSRISHTTLSCLPSKQKWDFMESLQRLIVFREIIDEPVRMTSVRILGKNGLSFIYFSYEEALICFHVVTCFSLTLRVSHVSCCR